MFGTKLIFAPGAPTGWPGGGGYGGSGSFSPAMDATNVSTAPGVTIPTVTSWNGSYQVQISTSPGFGSTVYDQTQTSPSFSVAGLQYLTVYYWRVRLYDTTYNTYGPWSPVMCFTTAPQPPAVPTVTPTTFDGLGQGASAAQATVSANTVTGEVEVYHDAGLTNLVDHSSGIVPQQVGPNFIVVDPNWSPPAAPGVPIDPAYQFYARWRATNAGGTSAWSQTQCIGYTNI